MDELHPFDFASLEDKYRLAEIYGIRNEHVIEDFSLSTDKQLDISNDGSASEYEDAQQTIVTGIPVGEEDA